MIWWEGNGRSGILLKAFFIYVFFLKTRVQFPVVQATRVVIFSNAHRRTPKQGHPPFGC
jgi:hypothetical protein